MLFCAVVGAVCANGHSYPMRLLFRPAGDRFGLPCCAVRGEGVILFLLFFFSFFPFPAAQFRCVSHSRTTAFAGRQDEFSCSFIHRNQG